MQIEVTEKEAREIYSDRYLRKYNKHLFVLMLLTLAMAFGGYLWLNEYFNQWISLAAVWPLIPYSYIVVKVGRASGKYAKDQIEGAR